MPTLNNLQIKQAKPKQKDYRLSDRNGLYLLITKKGSKLRRYNFSFENKKYVYAIGKYPDISLSNARKIHLGLMSKKANGPYVKIKILFIFFKV